MSPRWWYGSRAYCKPTPWSPTAWSARPTRRGPATSPEAGAPCATCAACCRSYLVPVCGQDVWRLSRSQRLAPEQFLVAWLQTEPGPDGFLLEPGGRPYGLGLGKRTRFAADQPCVFLMRLSGE